MAEPYPALEPYESGPATAINEVALWSVPCPAVSGDASLRAGPVKPALHGAGSRRVTHNDGMGNGASGMAGGTPSERVVEQRGRNRVIEYLDLAASFEAQRQYERDVPIAHVPYEVINQWEDNFPRGPGPDADLLSVYSPEEIEAIRQFHRVWDAAANAIADNYPSLADVHALPEWEQLRRAAASARDVFARRGTMPEDREVS